MPQQALCWRIARVLEQAPADWRANLWQESNATPEGAAECFVGAAFEQILARSPDPPKRDTSVAGICRTSGREAGGQNAN